MISVQQINIALSIVAATGSLWIARSAWRRRHTPGAFWFFGLVVCVSWMMLCYVFEAAAGYDLDAYVTFSKLEYIGLTFIPLFWLGFAMRNSGIERPMSRRLLVLVIPPLITIALAWTNEWHGLIWQEPRLMERNGAAIYEPIYGTWFWIYLVYAYVLFTISSTVLIRQALGSWQLYRAQAILLLVGTTLPWLSNLLQVFDDINPFPGVYVNAIFMGTAMVAMGVGLFRLRLLEIMPLARDTILENIPVGYVVVDTHTRIIALNRYITPYLNDPAGDPIGRLLADVFSSLPTPITEQQFSGTRRWQTGKQVIDIKVTPVIDWRGNRRGQLLVFNDVSAQVLAQEALEASEKRQRALLEALPDLMFRIRGDGTYLDYHAANPADLSRPPEEFLGKRMSDLLPQEISEKFLSALDQVLRTGTIAAFEYTTERHGMEHDFEARVVASGEDEVVAIIRDIATRKQAERRELALALEHERIAMISRFIQDTTHEFRTPLSVIRVSLHLLTRTEDADKREQRAAQIEEQVTRLVRLVDVLVKMSTLDGDVQFSLRWSNVNQVVEMIDIETAFGSVPQNPMFQYKLERDLPPVKIDPTWMREALQELVNNAARHTPPEGMITLRTYAESEWITIEVMDTGAGIPPEVLPRLFERFYRLDDAHSTPGFGLGLSIAQRIVELHGGRIDVESAPLMGSRFMIRLPMQPDHALKEPTL